LTLHGLTYSRNLKSKIFSGCNVSHDASTTSTNPPIHSFFLKK
jgi:hypothetical protein